MAIKKTRFHLSQSIEGALRNWAPADWDIVAEENNLSVKECKNQFWDLFREGKRLLPMGEPCEGFDYVKGCPGHEIKE